MSTVADAINQIGEAFKDELWAKSRTYCLVDIGTVLEQIGVEDDTSMYRDVKAVVPLKRPLEGGLPVQVNGNDLANYSQFKTGVAVPEWVAESSGLPHEPYQPHDSMTLVFAA